MSNIILRPEQSLPKIGAILSKGIARKAIKDKQSVIFSADKFTGSLFDYIELCGSVSQNEICKNLGYTRSTSYRKLKKLLDAGSIISEGVTKGKVYRLKKKHPKVR